MSGTRKKSPAAPDINRLVAGNRGTIRELYNHALRLIQLQQKLRQAIPAPLNDQITVASLADGVITIHTTSAAWAARLRFKIPDMLKSLEQEADGNSVKTIRIKVKPPVDPPPESRQKPVISPDTARLLQNVAESISDADLREALLRLSRNQ